jgi:hypothetical protein
MPAVIRPAMQDGRALTNWYSTCEFENGLKQKFNIASESQYRQQLQLNAKNFADRSKDYVNFTAYFGTSTCPKAVDAHESMVKSLARR